MPQGQFYVRLAQRIEPGSAPIPADQTAESIESLFNYNLRCPSNTAVDQYLRQELEVFTLAGGYIPKENITSPGEIAIYRYRAGVKTHMVGFTLTSKAVGDGLIVVGPAEGVSYQLTAPDWQEGDTLLVAWGGIIITILSRAVELPIIVGKSYVLSATHVIETIRTTTFRQETAPATAVNGNTWKDLLDMSVLTKSTKICGFMVTVAGGWAGSAQLRITDADENKIFPFQDEYTEGTDFNSGVQAIFNFPVEVNVASGYKFQFRSTNAADGAGQTLELDNLDVVELE